MRKLEERKSEPGIAGLVLPFLARWIIRGITSTVRIRKLGMEVLDSLEAQGSRAILVFFHGRQFLLAGVMADRGIGLIISLSRDGELQTRVMTGLGFKVVRGSASRSGARGLIGMRKLLAQGYHASFAVDGPKGPIHEVKPGAVYLAKKTGYPLVSIAASARPAHIFSRAWDKYLLPWPFGKGAVILGDPLYFDDDTSDGAMVRDCRILKEELLKLQERADEITGLKIRNQNPGARSQ
jgi:lysophospholipid acyltransferase (LPLAT)-like uncharacterized protein